MEKGKRAIFSRIGKAKEVSPVLPPSIIPVIFLSGSDYEMGYQYGEQAAGYIEWKKDAEWVMALKELGSRNKVIHEIKAAEYYVLSSTPEAVKQMKGMADGATAAGYEISYIDILLINTRASKPTATAVYPPGVEVEEISLEECSNWSAWGSTTKNGRLICAKSSDAEFEPQVALVAFPDEGNSYMSVVVAGELSGPPCMNNKGIFIGTSGGFATRDIDFDYGISSQCCYQHLLRFGDSASHGLNIFQQWKYPRCTNIQFSDVHGDAYVAEVTAAVRKVRKPGDFGEKDFIYSTNNYFTDELRDAIQGEKFINHGGWLGRKWSISSIPRNLQLWNMLNNYRGQIDLDFAMMMWRFPGNPPPYPYDEKRYEETQGKGWDQKICNLDNRRIAIMLPDHGDRGVAYICTGPAGRIAYPLKPKDGEWYQIDGTHTFYQLMLASNPAETVKAAKIDAHAIIAKAYREFMDMDHLDAGYYVLNQIFSQAKTEYYEGIYFNHKGLLSKGNQAHRYFARAATAFACSQAHAKQVCHAISPPATCPEELGLRPYGGEWATWADR